jgi:hypothetical protein
MPGVRCLEGRFRQRSLVSLFTTHSRMMPFSFSPRGPKEKGIPIYGFATGAVMPARLAVDPIMITFRGGSNRTGSNHNAR